MAIINSKTHCCPAGQHRVLASAVTAKCKKTDSADNLLLKNKIENKRIANPSQN